MHQRGSFVISFDTELAWGAIESGLWMIRERNGVYSQLRLKAGKLLKDLDDLNIPCTWACVGRMIEGREADGDGRLDPPSQRIRDVLKNGREESFYGKDLFENILNAKARHEIAWHSYYHVSLNSNEIDASYVERDFHKARQIGRKYNLDLKSYVFPHDLEGYYELLVKYGFTCCRGATKKASSSHKFGRIARGFQFVLLDPPMSEISWPLAGLTRVTGSMFFNPGLQRKGLLSLYKLKGLRGIERAVKEKKCFHIWVHPFNFAEIPGLLEAFHGVLRYAAHEREKGDLEIVTMSEYCDSLTQTMNSPAANIV